MLPGRGCNCHEEFQLFWLIFFLVDGPSYFAYKLPPGEGIPRCLALWSVVQAQADLVDVLVVSRLALRVFHVLQS